MQKSHRHLKAGLLPAILFTAISGYGESAESPTETELADDTKTTARKPGYHTGQFRIRPSLSITEWYDTNIFATDGDEITDWITTISPKFRFDSTWPRHSLKLRAGAEFGRYWEYDAENYLDYWANVEGRYTLTDSTDLFGGLGVGFEHEGRDSPEATLAGLEPTTYRTINGHAGLKTRFGNTTYRMGATFERLDFEDVQSGAGLLINDDRDRDLIGVGIRATHTLDEQNQVFIQALYDIRDYDLQVDLGGFDRDSHGFRAAAGLISSFGGSNRAELYLGMLEQHYDDDRFDTVRKPDFGGRLTWLPGKSAKLTASLERALNETTLNGSSGYLSTSLAGKFEYRVTPRLIPHFRFSYQMSDYLESGREDNSYLAEIGMKYFLARNAYILTGVRHIARDSNDEGLVSGSDDFDKNVLFLTLTTQGYPVLEPAISDYRTEAEAIFELLKISEDAVRFGRYNGLGDEGIEWNGELMVMSSDGKRNHATVHGRDLGLDNRSLSVEWGSQGRYDASVRYQQIPFREFMGQTIFDGVDSDRLTLPENWVAADSSTEMTQLSQELEPIEIGTKRKQLGIGTNLYSSDTNWTLSLDYDTESKEGITDIAGIIGTSPGNGRAALLPSPVDYTTNKLLASLAYTVDRTQLQVGYQGSFFYNNLEALTWQSPFDATGPRGAEGGIALPPDNQFHQLTLNGAHVLTETTRLTAAASVGLMLQDENFVPDTVALELAPSPLPRNSLDGEVYIYNANLALNSRPVRGLNLKASYRLNKRDNKTPRDTYTYYVNDSFGTLTNSPDTSTNAPYDYERATLKLNASYRLHRSARVNGEISRETFERSPSEVRKTTEEQGRLKLRLTPFDDVQVSLGSGIASREGSDYEPIGGENPLLRKYNISDRDRVTHSVEVSAQPSPAVSLGGSFSVNDDEYDETLVGLIDAKQWTATLDASYQMSTDLTAYGHIGREVYESRQAGSQVPDDPDWFVENEDTVDSLGIGVRWKKDARTSFGADYLYSSSTGEMRFDSDNALPPVQPFPDLETRLHSLRFYADYRWQKNTKLRFSYWYEKYDSDDWAVDDVNPNSIPQVLLLGEEDPDYSQHVFGIAVSVKL